MSVVPFLTPYRIAFRSLAVPLLYCAHVVPVGVMREFGGVGVGDGGTGVFVGVGVAQMTFTCALDVLFESSVSPSDAATSTCAVLFITGQLAALDWPLTVT